MDTRTRRDIQTVNITMGYLSDLPGQDLVMVIECGQHMLADLIVSDTLDPTFAYVSLYCDVVDSPTEALNIATRIDAQIASQDA